MYAIRQVISYLWSSADWIDQAGTRCDGIPVVGTAVGYPLHSSASYLRSASWSLYDFDVWVDGISTTASNALSAATSAYNLAAGTVWSMASNAYSKATSAYDLAAGTVWSVATSAYNRANEAYNFAAGTVWSTASNALSRANEAYQYAQSAVTNIGSTAWSWITSGYLQTFLSNWSSNLQATVLSWTEAAMGNLIVTAFDVLDRYWTSYTAAFMWTLDRLIALIGGQAAHFAAPLWWLFERIVEQLSQWEEK